MGKSLKGLTAESAEKEGLNSDAMRLDMGVRVLGILLFVCALAGCQTTKSYSVPNNTMEPAIRKGESVLIAHDAYVKHPPLSGDVVAAQMPDGALVLKRVIAVGGDTIEGKGLDVLLNGKPLNEPYVSHKGQHPGPLDNFGPFKIPKGKLFVMGDNRDYSFDSRSPQFGLVSIEQVKGRVLSISQSPEPSRAGRRVE